MGGGGGGGGPGSVGGGAGPVASTATRQQSLRTGAGASAFATLLTGEARDTRNLIASLSAPTVDVGGGGGGGGGGIGSTSAFVSAMQLPPAGGGMSGAMTGFPLAAKTTETTGPAAFQYRPTSYTSWGDMGLGADLGSLPSAMASLPAAPAPPQSSHAPTLSSFLPADASIASALPQALAGGVLSQGLLVAAAALAAAAAAPAAPPSQPAARSSSNTAAGSPAAVLSPARALSTAGSAASGAAGTISTAAPSAAPPLPQAALPPPATVAAAIPAALAAVAATQEGGAPPLISPTSIDADPATAAAAAATATTAAAAVLAAVAAAAGPAAGGGGAAAVRSASDGGGGSSVPPGVLLSRETSGGDGGGAAAAAREGVLANAVAAAAAAAAPAAAGGGVAAVETALMGAKDISAGAARPVEPQKHVMDRAGRGRRRAIQSRSACYRLTRALLEHIIFTPRFALMVGMAVTAIVLHLFFPDRTFGGNPAYKWMYLFTSVMGVLYVLQAMEWVLFGAITFIGSRTPWLAEVTDFFMAGRGYLAYLFTVVFALLARDNAFKLSLAGTVRFYFERTCIVIIFITAASIAKGVFLKGLLRTVYRAKHTKAIVDCLMYEEASRRLTDTHTEGGPGGGGGSVAGDSVSGRGIMTPTHLLESGTFWSQAAYVKSHKLTVYDADGALVEAEGAEAMAAAAEGAFDRMWAGHVQRDRGRLREEFTAAAAILQRATALAVPEQPPLLVEAVTSPTSPLVAPIARSAKVLPADAAPASAFAAAEPEAPVPTPVPAAPVPVYKPIVEPTPTAARARSPVRVDEVAVHRTTSATTATKAAAAAPTPVAAAGATLVTSSARELGVRSRAGGPAAPAAAAAGGGGSRAGSPPITRSASPALGVDTLAARASPAPSSSQRDHHGTHGRASAGGLVDSLMSASRQAALASAHGAAARPPPPPLSQAVRPIPSFARIQPLLAAAPGASTPPAPGAQAAKGAPPLVASTPSPEPDVTTPATNPPPPLAPTAQRESPAALMPSGTTPRPTSTTPAVTAAAGGAPPPPPPPPPPPLGDAAPPPDPEPAAVAPASIAPAPAMAALATAYAAADAAITGAAPLLGYEDIAPRFEETADAATIFRLLDLDGNGEVARDEFVGSLLLMFHAWQSAKTALASYGSISNTIGMLVSTIFWLAVVLITLAIYEIDFTTALVPFTTLVIGACVCVQSCLGTVRYSTP